VRKEIRQSDRIREKEWGKVKGNEREEREKGKKVERE
jgi:hypothetical protein